MFNTQRLRKLRPKWDSVKKNIPGSAGTGHGRIQMQPGGSFVVMKRWGIFAVVIGSFVAAPLVAQTSDDVGGRWSAQRANDWYAKQPWLVGANFVPSDAINELEMFQAATFNPALIDKELGMGESIGMNAMRVFLQDQLWQQDSKGFTQPLDAFLAIAARHHIHPLLVLFDSCWEPNPHLGPQHPPIPGVHNSGWVQSPGAAELADPSYEPQLKEY